MSDAAPRTPWLNRTVVGAGLTSLLADMAYETATSLLPGFFALLSIPTGYLGLVEGMGDAVSNFAKMGVGWYSDRIGRRKPFVTFGYLLTGLSLGLFALALSWPLILLGKSLAWLGKGIRGPVRNAILADAVEPRDLGKTFGFHRAGDTLGAIIGPLLASWLLVSLPGDWFEGGDLGRYHLLFALTVVPGVLSATVFALMIREKRFTPKPPTRFRATLAGLPPRYRRFLIGVGIFGLGDFSATLYIVLATLILTPAIGLQNALALGPIFYAGRNLAQALASFPVGWLSDRIGRRPVLIAGYALGALTVAGFALMLLNDLHSEWLLAALFTLAGIFAAAEEALENAVVADLVPDRATRGTAFGLLGCVNGVGDLVASVVVGTLIQTNPVIGLAFAAGLMALGTGAMAWATAERPS